MFPVGFVSEAILRLPGHDASTFDGMAVRPWRAPLNGAWYEAARAIVERIAEDLARPASREPGDANVVEAESAAALFFGYLAAETREQRWADQCLRHLDAAMDAVGATEPVAALFGGFVGVAWIAEHLAQRGVLAGESDVTDAVSDELVSLLAADAWRGRFDLISGLVGIGVYGLEVRQEETQRKIVGRVVHHLERLAEAEGNGITWRTSPRHRSPYALTQNADGHVDLGVAHGVPGVLALLARAHARGFSTTQTPSLVRNGLRWTLAQRLGDGTLPHQVAVDLPPAGARTAWCYGNPGVAAALTIAARAMGDGEAQLAAQAMGRRAATVEFEASGVWDHGFCHGSSGIAHTFRRLFLSTGDDTFEEAARHWYARTIDGVNPTAGEIPYLPYTPDVMSHPRRLLTGTPGVGLALLAATSDLEPAWDRLVLCSS